MADSRRLLRVEKELQHIVAQFILTGLNEKLFGLVSVSRVQVTKKLRTAKVYISVLGDDQQKQDSMQVLESRLHDIQRHVGRCLSMKYTPRISLVLDKGFDQMLKVQSLLHDIQKKS